MPERTPLDQAADALRQSITNACADRGGSCNGTPEGLLSVNAIIDPAIVARAVIAAIREPTKAMVDAGLEHAGVDDQVYPVDPTRAFEAMIDSALSERREKKE